MFGFSVRIIEDSSRLVVTNPAAIWLVLGAAVFTIWPLVTKLRQRPVPRGSVIAWGLITLLVYSFLIDSTRVTLDRGTQTATIRRFNFFHWTTQTVALNELDHAYLHTGATSSRIVLQFTDGHVTSLSSADQMGGKPEAVLAINRFLGRG